MTPILDKCLKLKAQEVITNPKVDFLYSKNLSELYSIINYMISRWIRITLIVNIGNIFSLISLLELLENTSYHA
jgi:hypothetical protein